ncbi:plasma-membrane choline transporter-domain-containing protein [Kalaharituber pfeilii]|nr:plasma-membrane choline transporter-domain-containing protein [Kalaharituber pfeilii]
MSSSRPPPGLPPGQRQGTAVDHFNALPPSQNLQSTQYVPPPSYTPPHANSSKHEYTFEDKFPLEMSKYNDVWAGLLFIADILGFAAVSALSIRGYATTRNVQGTGIYNDQNDFGLSTNTIILFTFVLGMSFVLSWSYFLAARAFSKQFIYATAILNILIGLGTAIYYFSRQYYSAAIVFLIFAVFYTFCFWTWRARIPFAALMLQTAIDVARRYGHVFLVTFLGGILALCFGAWFAVTLVAVYARYYPSADNPACQGGGCSKARVIGLLVFVTFSGYWITEFIKNAMHMTVSGVYGSWYFCAGSPAGMPKRPTIGAFSRTMTYSFGSVSLGSLIVSIIQILKQAATIARNENAIEGNLFAYIVFCFLRCILSVVEWAVQYFNHYAYSLIALYGKAYFPAARDTWRMVKDRGFDALINDCLIDPILTMGAVTTGYLSALLAYLYLQFTKPDYNRDGALTPVVLAFAFLVGLQMSNVILNPIKSGVSTIFVAMAWDPAVMMREHRDLYGKMVHVYPGLQYAVSSV